MSAVAFRILERTLIRSHNEKAPISRTLNYGRKEKISMIVYFCSIPMAFISIAVSIACYVVMAVIWIIPARSLEKAIDETPE